MRPANLTGGRRTGHGSGQRRREQERKKRKSERDPDGETERDNFICVDSIFDKNIQ